LSKLLGGTEVANNAIGGFGMEDITDSVACSCFSSCKWSVVGGGINDMEEKSVSKIVREMKSLVQRERAASGNKGVIIQGYVPDCDIYASGSTFNSIMDAYRNYAASTNNVWFVDPRNGLPGHSLTGKPCKDTSNKYRIEEDNSHPTPLSGKVMATAIANIIKSQTTGEPIGEEDVPNNDENNGPDDDEDSSNDENDGPDDEDDEDSSNDGSGDDEDEDEDEQNDGSGDESSSNDEEEDEDNENDGSGDESSSNDEDSSDDEDDEEEEVCEDANEFPWKGKQKNCKKFLNKQIKKKGKKKACNKFGEFCPKKCGLC